MASYFVACDADPDGAHPVHDRRRCPPGCFPAAGTEYLGEFGDSSQAIAVARLRYALPRACASCVQPHVSAPVARLSAQPLTPLRS